ncbi:MAG TPA: VOC family protein [Vicinamibacterales bacterium]|nr:VOC family protein [Vicinamibacterales bacterium]
MPDVNSHSAGTFSWPELATTDQKAGVTFYRDLFGWDVREEPIGPTEVYSMFQMRGRPVAAAYTMRPEEKQAGAPPHWNSYVTVNNVDEVVTKAQAIGAQVFAPPFDVMDAGRMAVLQDPTGAVFQVWQPKNHVGAMIVNEPGALCWTELTTSNLRTAEGFYTQLFGWTPKHSDPASGMEYTEMSNNGQPSVGMMPKPKEMPASVPSYWMPYFMVASVDDSAAKAKQLGGKLMVPPTDIPKTGRFSVVGDPQGAVFAIFQPAPRQ